MRITHSGPQDCCVPQPLLNSIKCSPLSSVITNSRISDNPIVAVNEAFEELTGYEEQEVVGRNCRFLSIEQNSPPQRDLRHAISHGHSILKVLENRKKDGTRFLNALMIAPICDESGAATFFVGTQMEVLEPIISDDSEQTASGLIKRLPSRQRQVLEGLVRGDCNKKIAATLGIELPTVKMHRALMLRRLGARSSADAIRIALEAQRR